MTDNPAAKRFTRRKKKLGMQEKSFTEKCQLEIDPKRGFFGLSMISFYSVDNMLVISI